MIAKRIVLTNALLMCLAGCGSGSGSVSNSVNSGNSGNPNPANPSPFVTSLTIRPRDTSKEVGETQAFLALANFSDGSNVDVTSTVQWSSSDPDRVSIGSNGLATANLPATVNITAQALGFSDSTTFTVNGLMRRISLSSAGDQANDGSSDPALSATGDIVAFSSAATNLVPGDTNLSSEIFVRNVATNVTTRVSVGPGGAQGFGSTFSPAISADGRLVAFDGTDSGLVANDTNFHRDIFIHDRQTGVTTRISLSAAGDQANGDSFDASISADGRFVAFQSAANNLVAGDTNGFNDIFVVDRQTSTVSRVSVDSSGGQSNGDSGTGFGPRISADGRFVAFNSGATNLVAGDTNGRADIFVHDRQSGATTRVSVDSAGVQGNGQSGKGAKPSISANGRFVVFESVATNLVAGDTNNFQDVFLHDQQTATTTRISVSSASAQANHASSFSSISDDGKFVVFDSIASNLVAGDNNGTWDVFVRDVAAGTTRRVSRALDGSEANGSNGGGTISPNGRFIVFASSATNLVAGDTNGQNDVFLTTR